MRFFEKVISKVNESMMWIAGCFILIMGFVTTTDVLLRSTINSSIQWAFSLNGYLCAAVALLTGGYALLANQHVKVDIFYAHFPPRVRSIVDICTSSLLFLLCGVFVWMGMSICLESLVAGYRTEGVLDIPLFIPQMLIPLGGLLLGLQAIIDLVHNIKVALGLTTAKEEDKL